MKQQQLAWWQKAVVYQIYPRSFADSNGDGIGDLPGILSKLDYLQSLGVDVLWLSPVYASPNEDNGYDISDYTSIHPDFGTMEDFDRLMAEADRRGMKIIMDLVINHTSSEHEWFQKSRAGVEPYRDFYYWSDSWPGTPNNWTGFFGEKCWEYDEVRGASYLHLFARHQPDLNYHNPLVWQEIEKVLTFWLEKGVKGFRCDVINILYKDSLASSKKKLILTGSEHYLTLDGTHAILRRLNEVLRPYDAFTVGETVFVNTKQATDLTAPARQELNMVFGFEHMETDQHIVKWFRAPFRFRKFVQVLDRWQNEVPWNTIYFENHDQLRSVSRYGSAAYPRQSAKLLATLLLTLRGTPFIYQGQEIGMTNFDYTSMADVQDVESHNVDALLRSLHVPAPVRWRMIRGGCRDHARTPMQWTAQPGAGFTAGTPWLKLNGNYKTINVQAAEADETSVLHCYKTLLALRRATPDLQEGGYRLLQAGEALTLYRRGGLTVALNHSDKPVFVPRLAGKQVLFCTEGELKNHTLAPWQAVIAR